MSDVIIEVPPEFCYGVIESVNGSTITLTKESWAPGVWCGTEKMWVEIRPFGIKILITGVNLDTRELSYYGGKLVGDFTNLQLFRIEDGRQSK